MNTDTKSGSVAIIGAGITGLTTGFLLDQDGVDVTIFEKSGDTGGVIQSIRKDGWLLERGPNTVMAKDEQLWELIEQLELSDQITRPGPEASRRYIVKNGTPQALPTSLWEFIRTSIISTSAKFRLFKEPFIAKSDEPETIADFFERRLGREVLDYAVNPFVAGIYAGDPQKLSIRHTLSKVYELEQEYGSIVKGMAKSGGGSKSKPSSSSHKKGLISFKNGIQQLPQTMQQRLGEAVQFGSPVTRVTSHIGKWKVHANNNSTEFDALVYTAPLHKLSSIDFALEQPELLEKLHTLPYAPIATIGLGFRRSQIQHSLGGFGMLVPEVEPFNILGCLFSSSLFEGRAPEDHILLTCFVGGDRNPEHLEYTDQELYRLVMEDLQALLGCSGDPVFQSLHRWQQAIPQYYMDYQDYLDDMEVLEEKNPGFFLAGSFREAVSVPGCISNAHETAASVASFL